MKEKYITDEELVIKIRCGSKDGFNILYCRYKAIAVQLGRTVSPIIASMVHTNDFAILFSQTINKAIQKYTFGASKFISYFTTILKFELSTFARDFALQKEKLGLVTSLSFRPNQDDDCCLEDVIEDTRLKKDYDVMTMDDFLRFYNHIQEYCPAETNKIMQMIYSGYSYTEISKKLKLKYTVVRKTVQMVKTLSLEMANNPEFFAAVLTRGDSIATYKARKS